MNLAEIPKVLQGDKMPVVVVDEFAASTVNMRGYIFQQKL